jgi:hypothetical protein
MTAELETLPTCSLVREELEPRSVVARVGMVSLDLNGFGQGLVEIDGEVPESVTKLILVCEPGKPNRLIVERLSS